MNRLIFRLIMTGIAGASLAAGACAIAQPFPAKPVRFIVPYAAGGGVDIVTRTLAQKLTEIVGQSFVVDNRPGGNANIASEAVAKAAPDGYMLLMGSPANAVNGSLFSKLPYDTLRDFAPVSLIGYGPLVLVVHPSVPAHTVKELIALCKARAGQINYASGGNGSPQHIAMEVFAARTGVKLNHVPYRGATQAALDVVGGQIPCMFTATSIVLGNIRDGKVRALGVGSLKRSPLLPDVPTIAEGGVAGFNYFTWAGIFVPKGTPKTVIDKLNAEAIKAVNDPATRDRLRDSALDPVGSTADELGRITRDSYERMGALIRKIGLEPQ